MFEEKCSQQLTAYNNSGLLPFKEKVLVPTKAQVLQYFAAALSFTIRRIGSDMQVHRYCVV